LLFYAADFPVTSILILSFPGAIISLLTFEQTKNKLQVFINLHHYFRTGHFTGWCRDAS